VTDLLAERKVPFMAIAFGPDVTGSYERASGREWLEANGLGGWASGTISGAHTRRYHGLLVAATRPPVGRMVLLSKLPETIVAGGERFELDSNRFDGTVHPDGYRYLTRFALDPFPTFEYEAGGVGLRKTVAAIHGENTTAILFELTRASAACAHTREHVAVGREHGEA